MAVITKWANVAVSVQSALAATKTITAITKNTTGVVSSTAHGYSNGDYVLILAQGLSQVNYRFFHGAASAPDSWAELRERMIDRRRFNDVDAPEAALRGEDEPVARVRRRVMSQKETPKTTRAQ